MCCSFFLQHGTFVLVMLCILFFSALSLCSVDICVLCCSFFAVLCMFIFARKHFSGVTPLFFSYFKMWHFLCHTAFFAESLHPITPLFYFWYVILCFVWMHALSFCSVALFCFCDAVHFVWFCGTLFAPHFLFFQHTLFCSPLLHSALHLLFVLRILWNELLCLSHRPIFLNVISAIIFL